ncbi:MAG: hypothetical protein U0836_17275 [Pirellulales bacterium]
MVPRSALYWLLVGLLALPVILCIVLGVGRLLAGLEDAAGALILDRVALLLALIWAVDLVGLVAALGLDALARRD